MRTAVLMCSVFALVPAAAGAQGFGIYEQSACAMGRGTAGVAEPCQDGSAIYVNPAGLSRKGMLIGLGGTYIFGSGSFTSDSGAATNLVRNDFKRSFPIHGYFHYGLNEKLAIGVGAYLPYGLGVQWPLDFGGRFVSYDAHLTTWYVQPTVAYAINPRISVGGGLVIAIGSVELDRREDLATVPLGTVPGLTFGALVDSQTDFAATSLSASGAHGFGANVGVMIELNDRFRVGAQYLTHVALDYHGDATFTAVQRSFVVTKQNPLGIPVGTPLDDAVSQVLASLPNQSATTSIDLPAQFAAGVSIHASPRVKVFADYQWVGWSSFDTVTLDFSNPIPPDEHIIENYRSTSTVRSGVEFKTADMFRVSAGYFYNQAAAPDESVTPTLPEASRHHLSAGLGWDWGTHVTLDVAYQFVQHADRRGRIVNPPPGQVPTVALNSGVYRERGNLFGLTLTVRP